MLARERIHLRVVAAPGAHVGHLLDQHRRMLAGEARVPAVGAAGRATAVAPLADFERDLAAQHVAFRAQRLQFFALHLVPHVVRGLDALDLGLRLDLGECRRRRKEQKRGDGKSAPVHRGPIPVAAARRHSAARYSATAFISLSVMRSATTRITRPLSLLRVPALKSIICWMA